jgi:hypothetical protein
VEPAAFPQVDPELKTAPETLHQVSSSTRNGVTNGSAKAGAASGPVGSANSTQGVNGSTGGSNSSTAGTTHPPVLSSQSSTLSATPSSLAMSPPSSSGGGCSTSACTTCSTAVMTWAETRCSTHSIPDEVARDLDVVVVLGGDGTLLWACSLFGNRWVRGCVHTPSGLFVDRRSLCAQQGKQCALLGLAPWKHCCAVHCAGATRGCSHQAVIKHPACTGVHLHLAAALCCRPVPPMVPFNMGSLGFLTPFPPSQMEPIIATIVNGGSFLKATSLLHLRHSLLSLPVARLTQRIDLQHTFLYPCSTRPRCTSLFSNWVK